MVVGSESAVVATLREANTKTQLQKPTVLDLDFFGKLVTRSLLVDSVTYS